ncbi:hypothetical protein ABMA32_14000 [Mesorhizobium sp. VNQ89]|uniref:hypothetical protein n=1 Tax=Mesorhizobium quangtriensis TaxID=3157709 RepID=UPI0032B75C91
MPLLVDTTPNLLIDIYRTLPQEARAEFRDVAGDFSYGLNATIEGAHRAMKSWVASPPSWISAARQQARQRFLATLDNFTEAQALAA